MLNIYLDDLRKCPESFTIARNINEAIELFNNNEVDILSLDHDLGEGPDGSLLPTGYDFVKYFCQYGLKANKIYIHTDNSVGRENMYKTLLAAQKRGFISESIQIFYYPLVPNRM